jgi:hypothetical protein
MKKNPVIQALEVEIGTDKIDYISGTIVDIGKSSCVLSSETGSVYGFAIKIEAEIDTFKTLISNVNSFKSEFEWNDWKSIGDNYYPLYWGKDINMRSRLYAHTKEMKSTGTLQLNNLSCLESYEVIYGAIPCVDYENHEKEIKTKYPDILKTIKGTKDQLKIKDLCQDESS